MNVEESNEDKTPKNTELVECVNQQLKTGDEITGSNVIDKNTMQAEESKEDKFIKNTECIAEYENIESQSGDTITSILSDVGGKNEESIQSIDSNKAGVFNVKDVNFTEKKSDVILEVDENPIQDQNTEIQELNLAVDKEGSADSSSNSEIIYDDGVDATMEKMFSEDSVSSEIIPKGKGVEDAEVLLQENISNKNISIEDEVLDQFDLIESNDNLLEVLEAGNCESNNDICDETIVGVKDKDNSISKSLSSEEMPQNVSNLENIDLERKVIPNIEHTPKVELGAVGDIVCAEASLDMSDNDTSKSYEESEVSKTVSRDEFDNGTKMENNPTEPNSNDLVKTVMCEDESLESEINNLTDNSQNYKTSVDDTNKSINTQKSAEDNNMILHEMSDIVETDTLSKEAPSYSAIEDNVRGTHEEQENDMVDDSKRNVFNNKSEVLVHSMELSDKVIASKEFEHSESTEQTEHVDRVAKEKISNIVVESQPQNESKSLVVEEEIDNVTEVIENTKKEIENSESGKSDKLANFTSSKNGKLEQIKEEVKVTLNPLDSENKKESPEVTSILGEVNTDSSLATHNPDPMLSTVVDSDENDSFGSEINSSEQNVKDNLEETQFEEYVEGKVPERKLNLEENDPGAEYSDSEKNIKDDLKKKVDKDYSENKEQEDETPSKGVNTNNSLLKIVPHELCVSNVEVPTEISTTGMVDNESTAINKVKGPQEDPEVIVQPVSNEESETDTIEAIDSFLKNTQTMDSISNDAINTSITDSEENNDALPESLTGIKTEGSETNILKESITLEPASLREKTHIMESSVNRNEDRKSNELIETEHSEQKISVSLKSLSCSSENKSKDLTVDKIDDIEKNRSLDSHQHIQEAAGSNEKEIKKLRRHESEELNNQDSEICVPTQEEESVFLTDGNQGSDSSKISTDDGVTKHSIAVSVTKSLQSNSEACIESQEENVNSETISEESKTSANDSSDSIPENINKHPKQLADSLSSVSSFSTKYNEKTATEKADEVSVQNLFSKEENSSQFEKNNQEITVTDVEKTKGLKRPYSTTEDSKNNETDVSKILRKEDSERDNLKEDSNESKEDKSDAIPSSSYKLDESSIQTSEQAIKTILKIALPKDALAPVRVSARQKQRKTAAAAALAAEQQGKDIPDLTVKKSPGLDKSLEKRVKKSSSPTKELQIKISSPKPADYDKQLVTQKSPKSVDYNISSQLSPKKLLKDVSRDKLEPITLKLSKEDNPVIIRSSSLSPKRVLSPLSPQTKTLGYTLKIGKDSTTIIPKDPNLSPKPRDSSPKSDVSNKVGYVIKDTGLTITPVAPEETQDQKLNKITLKLSKAGGHPEIKQEKHETWKAIRKLGEIDIVPVEGKGTSDKKKEKSDSTSLKVQELTVEPSSSNVSKLQGLLTQAPLNQSEDSDEVQFVGFTPTNESNQSTQPIPYDIGLVKQEPDPLGFPKKRGRPRKMIVPGETTHSVSHSLPPGLTAKDILAASLQHQTLQQHMQQMQQPMPMMPTQEEECSAPMFPVPLFDLAEDTFMDPSPSTIFPDQVQPEMIMRSARGRPIGRSRRSRGAGLLFRASERGGPRGRPRGSRGLKRMLAEMEALSYPDMEQPITLDNIDAEIGPRDHPVSQITETTMALLRKSIEGKHLEKKARKSDGSEDESRDRELDAKVREMKEKIEAAYQAELRSPGKITPEKDGRKKSIEKSDLKDVFKKSPPGLIPLSFEKSASGGKSDQEEYSTGLFSSVMSGESSFKRKSSDESSEVSESKKVCIDPDKSEESNQPMETSVTVADDSEALKDSANQMDVDQSSTNNDETEKSEPEPPPKPVKPRPKTKAEIKRIKREKDRIRREAKKLAALEALKAPPPNPCEEDTRMSATDNDLDDPLGTGIKKNRMEVGDPEGKEFTVEQIAEYQWPLQGGELYMIQEQISTYLGVKSFKRKYPDVKRRPVEMEERTFLCDSGLVSESMCDLGLTAVSSSEVLDIMFQDFQDQYEELRKYMREKQARELINKQKEKKKFEQSLSKSDLKEQAIQSSMSWNQALNRSRSETRKCHLDLQTWTIQYPRNKAVTMTKPTPKLGNYPVALIAGQYADYYKRYTPQEMRYWPVNTVLYGPLQPNERHSTGGSEGSQSESEDSSSSDDSSDSSSDGEDDCKLCGGGKRSGAMAQCSQCGHNSTTASVWA